MNDDLKLFERMRELAKDQCDEAIRDARSTLQARLTEIDCLEANLIGIVERSSPDPRTTFDALIWSCVPIDRAFTFKALKRAIENTDADPMPSIPTLRAHIRKWVNSGKLKPVKNPDSLNVKLWAMPSVQAEEPLPAIAEMIADILEHSNSGLRPVDIGVEMLERGWDMDREPVETVAMILRALRARPDFFCENSDGQWKLTQ